MCERRSPLASGARRFSAIFFAALSPSQLDEEPRLGITPIALDTCAREAEDARGILLAQPDEVTELHELGLDRVLRLELGEGFVDGQEVLGGSRGRDIHVVEVLPFQPPAMLLGSLAAGVLDQDAMHGLGSSGQEVTAAVPPLGLVATDEPEIGFVHQGRRLERLPWFLPGEPLSGDLAKFAIDERQELLRGPWVAVLDGREEAGHVIHG